MSRAAANGEPQSTVQITGVHDEALASACAAAQRQQPGSVCQIAARMYPQGCTIAGHAAAVEKARSFLPSMCPQLVIADIHATQTVLCSAVQISARGIWDSTATSSPLSLFSYWASVLCR